MKIKWKTSSSHVEEHKSVELSGSNAAFDPAFTVQLGALDGSTKIHFAVKGTRAVHVCCFHVLIALQNRRRSCRERWAKRTSRCRSSSIPPAVRDFL